jgi:hypothetical protein
MNIINFSQGQYDFRGNLFNSNNWSYLVWRRETMSRLVKGALSFIIHTLP